MNSDYVPLIVGGLVLLSSLISLRIGLSVAIIEILLGTIAGNFGLETQNWMLYLANFGGIILTYLAGTEIDTKLMRENLKESMLIGSFSFILPFLGTFIYVYYIVHWTLQGSLIAGCALSTTSLAVVYSVLVETGLSATTIGKKIMSATFITDMGTALTLSLLFIKPSIYTLLFIAVSTILIILFYKYSIYVLRNPRWSNKVIEPEIKFIFLILLAFIYFAKLGDGHAVLPAFILGMLMSKHFKEQRKTVAIRNKLRTVAYAIVTPIFFIVGGMKISFSLLFSVIGLFIILFFIKLIMKFIGVYFFAKRYMPNGTMYTTLLMSTGLTFGTISSMYGLQAGLINQVQYSLLVGVVLASAIIPTFIAQKWFVPKHTEDIIDNGEI
jgi:Kef-type K+ transport system membrane component KefB